MTDRDPTSADTLDEDPTMRTAGGTGLDVADVPPGGGYGTTLGDAAGDTGAFAAESPVDALEDLGDAGPLPDLADPDAST